MRLNVEIINTGTELMLGSVINTHAAWLGKRLTELGLRVERQVTVPDGMPIRDALKESIERASIVLVTGGLGPTSDDMTREITAELLGRELCEEPEALKIVTRFFEQTGRQMPSVNLKQAKVPEGAIILENPIGTAPGLYLPPTEQNPSIFLLPGPPGELRKMYDEEVLPLLMGICREAGIAEIVGKVFKTSGIGESLVNEKVDAILTSVPHLEVGYCAHPGAVDIRLMGSLEAVMEGGKIVRAELDPYIFSEDGEELEEVLVKKLSENKLKLATAESCTGGMIAARVTDVPGASSVFNYGWVTYANEAKAQELGVPESMLKEYGAVSKEVARAMAIGAKANSGADIAVAVTGIAGPEGGSEEKPVGTVWLAWATADGVVTRKAFFPGERRQFRERVVQAALGGVFSCLSRPEEFYKGE